eukprot:CAMPEP_0119006482 /NCGR_PEP_ID=MMETSP1176-20130426/2317_1 /TAXON_ID=265551 /ORGANISM="Synedropsis recta cf, Strain CCMP1620" /LENGTH=305 /DNA_ID=CAMNT_0006958395 /DNA_START=66 /DNA_END=979 /DNA_ORIENTATION=-
MTAKAALMTALAMDRTFVCSDGVKLAAQCYPPAQAQGRHKVLLLHGWLDNCRTFWKLAPQLEQDDVVALDLPGHGRSDHKGNDTPPLVLAEAAYYVADVLQQLEWNSGVTLIGHSMGAAISLMYSATFPEQIERLVLLEGAGPLAKSPHDVPQHLRAHIEKRLKGNRSLYQSNGSKGPRVYPSLEKAAETRQSTAKLFPGKQYLSIEAARELVDRALSSDETGNGLTFQHDVRLQWPSLLYMTTEQVEAMQVAVQCPTYLMLAEDGWPYDADMLESTKERLQPTRFDVLPGSHHFHADPDTADAV